MIIHYRYPDGRPFPASECAGLQVLVSGSIVSNAEDVFIRKDGTFLPVVYSSAPIAKTEITGLVVVFRDMTAQKEAEEALRRSREELRNLANRLQAAREEERTEVARNIHDELSGALTVLKMDLSLLPDRAARNDGSFTEKLGSMAQMIDRTLDTVRHIVTELRPIVLDKIGLVAAIEWQTEEFQKHSGIVCETHLPTREISLDPARSTALFRILQEALTNVARHSGARKAIVELRIEAGNIVLTVCDDGKGIDEMLINAPDSIGLLGIRERMLPFGGRTQVACRPEGGTLVCVELPAN